MWNLRQAISGTPIFGIGQCHLEGIAWAAADFAAKGYRQVLWLNMREEPVVFLGGQACGVRFEDELNENVAYLAGIEGLELDAMEVLE